MREELAIPNEPMMESKMSEKEEYKPSKTEALREYEIFIRFLNKGCVVRVGCKEIAFSSNEEAITELGKYFNDPYETQKSWRRILD
jgi:hypothetical protein